MSTEEIKSKTDFIQGLKIAHSGYVALPQVALEASATDPAAFVVEGSTVSFVAGVSPQFQSDILNSTLLAQEAANYQYDREADAAKWYGFYKSVLENIGWVIQGFAFTKFQASGGSYTCDKAILEILAAIASSGEMAIVQATLNAMKNLSDNDRRIKLFEKASHNLHQGNLQIGIARESGNVVSLSIAGFEFKSHQNITRILFFSWETSSSELYQSSQTMTLNVDVYAQVRQQVIEKLGDNAKRFIAPLPIRHS